jgi:hypothetical protein
MTFKLKQFILTFKFLIQNTKFERIETSPEFEAASSSAVGDGRVGHQAAAAKANGVVA